MLAGRIGKVSAPLKPKLSVTVLGFCLFNLFVVSMVHALPVITISKYHVVVRALDHVQAFICERGQQPPWIFCTPLPLESRKG